MQRASRQDRVTPHGVIAAGFIACAMVLGGGGSPAPTTELLLQIAFVIAGLAWLWSTRHDACKGQRPPRLLLLFGAALLIVPFVQLVPLSPAIWQALPQRELQVATLSLVAAEDGWRPLSIAPHVTLAGWLALVPAIGTMWAVSTLGEHDRAMVLATVAILALAGAILGAMQMAVGQDAFRLYERSHRGWLTAFHANRNAAADVLVIGALATTSAFATWSRKSAVSTSAGLTVAAVLLVLFVALLLTGSRAGIALGMISLVVHFYILRPDRALSLTKARVAIVAATIAVIGVLIAAENQQIVRVLQRFDVTTDARIAIWQDSWTALLAYWPVGSGVGTFGTAFQPFESLAALDSAFVNRAHNDYIEFLIEGGMLAAGLLLTGALAVVMLARHAWRVSPQNHALQLFALGTLALVALHSIVDYPLRNMAVACLAGMAMGLLTKTPQTDAGRSGRKGRDE